MIWRRNLVWSSHILVWGEKNKKIITTEIQHCCSDPWLLSRPVTDNEDGCDWIVFILESKTLGLLRGLPEESETLPSPCDVPWLSWPSSQSRAPAKGRCCVDTDGFCPFLVELWVCLGNTAICWIPHPSTPRSARTALVPGRALKKIQGLQCRFEIPWEARRVSREQSSREQPCSILRSLSVLGTATAPAGWAKALSKSPESTTWGCCQGRLYCPRGTQNTAQTDHLWTHIFHQRDYLGWKCLLPPSHLCAAGVQLLRLDLINAHMGRFVWPGRWYYWIGLSNLSVSSATIFMNI